MYFTLYERIKALLIGSITLCELELTNSSQFLSLILPSNENRETFGKVICVLSENEMQMDSVA